MSRTTLVLYSSALVASFACRGLAAELRVPDQYPTIQGAINEAAAGDTVLVAGGLYSQSFAVPRSKSGMTIKADGAEIVWCHASAAVHAADVAIEGIRFLLRECGVYVPPGASCSLRSIHCNGQTHGIFI
ncbi:MAG: hypothetical protein ACP5KN_09350, partial [Armatimonadota bacterium]